MSSQLLIIQSPCTEPLTDSRLFQELHTQEQKPLCKCEPSIVDSMPALEPECELFSKSKMETLPKLEADESLDEVPLARKRPVRKYSPLSTIEDSAGHEHEEKEQEKEKESSAEGTETYSSPQPRKPTGEGRWSKEEHSRFVEGKLR